MSDRKYSMVLRRCRLLGAIDDIQTVDIAIDGDKIAAVSPQISDLGESEIDVGCKLVCPPFVESHVHLDSALTAGEPRWNDSGTLF